MVAAAAARCFFSKVLDGVGAQPDANYAELDAPLRETLTVGRPIAAHDGPSASGGTDRASHEGVASGRAPRCPRAVHHRRLRDDRRARPAGRVAADAALPGRRGLHRRDGRPRRRPTSASRCCSPTPRRWSSCRARAHAENRGSATRSTSTCCPSASTSGPAATSRPSRGSTTPTSTRSARRTTRSPRSATRRPEGGGSVWDERLDALGARHPDAVLAFVGPDGFPFAVRVPVRAERDAGLVLVDADPVGAPIEPGLACLCADAPGRRGFHVLGDLDEDQRRLGPAPAPGRRPRARHPGR